jgi:hypothetical protein
MQVPNAVCGGQSRYKAARAAELIAGNKVQHSSMRCRIDAIMMKLTNVIIYP